MRFDSYTNNSIEVILHGPGRKRVMGNPYICMVCRPGYGHTLYLTISLGPWKPFRCTHENVFLFWHLLIMTHVNNYCHPLSLADGCKHQYCAYFMAGPAWLAGIQPSRVDVSNPYSNTGVQPLACTTVDKAC